MTRRLVALVLGATITALPAVALAQDDETTFPDVPMYRVDEARKAIHPGPAPVTEPAVVWSLPVGSAHDAAPIIHRGTLLYGTNDGRVLALDPASGSERWTWQGTGPIGFLVSGGGSVFVGDETGVFRALDVASGTEQWSVDKGLLTGGARATLADGVLYAPDADGNVYGIDPASGELTWSWEGPVPITSVTVVDGVGYFGGNDGRVFSVSLADGTERWRPVQLLSAQVSSMGVADGWLYVSSLQGAGQPSGELYAIDGATGRIAWRYRGPSGRQIGPVSMSDGVVYAESDADGIYALDARTGAQIWHVDGPPSYAPPAIVGGAIYLTNPDGLVTAFDRSDGHQLWEFTVGSGGNMHVAISGGLIFLGDATGTLMALGDGSTVVASQPVRSPAATDDALELLSTWDATTIDGMDQPSGMDVGPDGNFYLVNAARNEVLVLDADGDVVRRWGDTGSTEGAFDFFREPGDPFSAIGGVAVAQDGSVYVADTANRRVQKFGPDGDFQLSWGSFGSGDGQFLEPFDLDVGPDSTVYVVDDVRDDIQRFTADGKYLQTIGRHGTGDGELNFTGSIAVAPDGTLYNGDWSNHRIQAWDAAGNFLWSLGSRGSDPGQFTNPYDVAVDSAGRLYASDGLRIQVFNPDQSVLGLWYVPDPNEEMAGVGAVTVMPDGSIVAASPFTDRIYKLRLKE
jgi:outer membrane protein assembly factor BamB